MQIGTSDCNRQVSPGYGEVTNISPNLSSLKRQRFIFHSHILSIMGGSRERQGTTIRQCVREPRLRSLLIQHPRLMVGAEGRKTEGAWSTRLAELLLRSDPYHVCSHVTGQKQHEIPRKVQLHHVLGYRSTRWS